MPLYIEINTLMTVMVLQFGTKCTTQTKKKGEVLTVVNWLAGVAVG